MPSQLHTAPMPSVACVMCDMCVSCLVWLGLYPVPRNVTWMSCVCVVPVSLAVQYYVYVMCVCHNVVCMSCVCGAHEWVCRLSKHAYIPRRRVTNIRNMWNLCVMCGGCGVDMMCVMCDAWEVSVICHSIYLWHMCHVWLDLYVECRAQCHVHVMCVMCDGGHVKRNTRR